ncbi:hypothetical protein [Alicyclobacillus fructus]|nr:hypothetical protein [Alicyclobacillus fructus]
MIRKPESIAKCDSVEWIPVEDGSGYIHGCAELTGVSDSSVSAWAEWLSTPAVRKYVDRWVSNGFIKYPDGRLYFYPLIPVPSYGDGQVESCAVCIDEIEELMDAMREVIQNQCHPYVLWDLDETTPWQSEKDKKERETSETSLQGVVKQLSRKWKDLWRSTGVPDFLERGTTGKTDDRSPRHGVWEWQSGCPTVYAPPDVSEVSVLPVDTEETTDMLNDKTLYCLAMKSGICDFDRMIACFSHISLKPGFTLRVKSQIHVLKELKSQWEDKAPQREDKAVVGVAFPPATPYLRFGGHKQLFSFPPLSAIEGDGTPMAYFEATILYHLLQEKPFGGHLLPLNKRQLETIEKRQKWHMLEPEPEIWHPHYYLTPEGYPTVVFYVYTINIYDTPQETIQRYVHTFYPGRYNVMNLRVTKVAYTDTIHGV